MRGTRPIEPEQMRVLVAVAEARSFTRAAETLRVSQQAVSAAIKRLEDEVGRRIVNRMGAEKPFLTPDGEALLMYGRQLLAVTARIDRHFAEAPIQGTVRLGYVSGFATLGLPMVLGQLRARHPDLEISAETGRTDRLLRRMEAGGLDLVVGSQCPGAGLGDVLGRLPLRWAGRADGLDDKRRPVPLVVPPPGDPVREITLAVLASANRVWSVRFESENRDSRWAAALAGLGVGLFARLEELGDPADARAELPEAGCIEAIVRVAVGAGRYTRAFAEVVRGVVPAMLPG